MSTFGHTIQNDFTPHHQHRLHSSYSADIRYVDYPLSTFILVEVGKVTVR